MRKNAQQNHIHSYKTALLTVLTWTIHAGLFVIFAIPIAMALPFYLVHEMLTGEFRERLGVQAKKA